MNEMKNKFFSVIICIFIIAICQIFLPRLKCGHCIRLYICKQKISSVGIQNLQLDAKFDTISFGNEVLTDEWNPGPQNQNNCF